MDNVIESILTPEQLEQLERINFLLASISKNIESVKSNLIELKEMELPTILTETEKS